MNSVHIPRLCGLVNKRHNEERLIGSINSNNCWGIPRKFSQVYPSSGKRNGKFNSGSSANCTRTPSRRRFSSTCLYAAARSLKKTRKINCSSQCRQALMSSDYINEPFIPRLSRSLIELVNQSINHLLKQNLLSLNSPRWNEWEPVERNLSELLCRLLTID